MSAIILWMSSLCLRSLCRCHLFTTNQSVNVIFLSPIVMPMWFYQQRPVSEYHLFPATVLSMWSSQLRWVCWCHLFTFNHDVNVILPLRSFCRCHLFSCHHSVNFIVLPAIVILSSVRLRCSISLPGRNWRQLNQSMFSLWIEVIIILRNPFGSLHPASTHAVQCFAWIAGTILSITACNSSCDRKIVPYRKCLTCAKRKKWETASRAGVWRARA